MEDYKEDNICAFDESKLYSFNCYNVSTLNKLKSKLHFLLTDDTTAYAKSLLGFKVKKRSNSQLSQIHENKIEINVVQLFLTDYCFTQNDFDNFMHNMLYTSTFSHLVRSISFIKSASVKIMLNQNVNISNKVVDKIINSLELTNLVVNHYKLSGSKKFASSSRDMEILYILNRKGYIFTPKQVEKMMDNKIPIEYFSGSLSTQMVINIATSSSLYFDLGICCLECNFMKKRKNDFDTPGENIKIDNFIFNKALNKFAKYINNFSTKFLNIHYTENLVNKKINKYNFQHKFYQIKNNNNMCYYQSMYGNAFEILYNKQKLVKICSDFEKCKNNLYVKNYMINMKYITLSNIISHLKTCKTIDFTTITIVYEYLLFNKITEQNFIEIIKLLKTKNCVHKVTFVNMNHNKLSTLNNLKSVDIQKELSNFIFSFYSETVVNIFHIKLLYIIIFSLTGYNLPNWDYINEIVSSDGVDSIFSSNIYTLMLDVYRSLILFSAIPDHIVSSVLKYNLSPHISGNPSSYICVKNKYLILSYTNTTNYYNRSCNIKSTSYINSRVCKYIPYDKNDFTYVVLNQSTITLDNINAQNITIRVASILNQNTIDNFSRVFDISAHSIKYREYIPIFSNLVHVQIDHYSIYKNKSYIMGYLDYKEQYYIHFLNGVLEKNILNDVPEYGNISISEYENTILLRHMCNYEKKATLEKFASTFNIKFDNYCKFALYHNNYLEYMSFLKSFDFKKVKINYTSRTSTYLHYYCTSCSENHILTVEYDGQNISYSKNCHTNYPNKVADYTYGIKKKDVIKSLDYGGSTRVIALPIELCHKKKIFGCSAEEYVKDMENLSSTC